MKGGADKCSPKAIAPRGVMLPWKIFNFKALKCDFQHFQGQFEVV